MKTAIKLLITIAIFYLLSTKIDFSAVLNTAAHANSFYLFFAFAFQTISTYIAGARWYLIMHLLDFHEHLFYFIRSYFKGSFFNQVLPGSVGGDAVRVYELISDGNDKKDSFYGVFVDRVIGLVGLLVLTMVSNIAFYGEFPLWLFQYINIITAIGILGFILMMNLHRFTFLKELAYINLFFRLGERLKKLYTKKRTLLLHIFISVIVHIFSVLSIFMIALSINMQLPLTVFLIAIPPVLLLTIVPISLAGWGVREGAMVYILTFIGALQSDVLTVSIVYGIILILSSLPGAYFWNESKKVT